MHIYKGSLRNSSVRLKLLILMAMVLSSILQNNLFAQIYNSQYFNYNENNDYISDAFPATLISKNFSIPVDSDSLMVLYPAAAENRRASWSKALKKQLGVNIPFRSANSLSRSDLTDRHLIIMGNISDNKWVMELYKQRYAFADAYFPGEGGFIIHPAQSIWNYDRNILVIGASRTQDLNVAFETLLDEISINAGSIGSVRVLNTNLEFPDPLKTVQPILDRTLENAGTRMAPYATIANWGFSYHLSGNHRWAKHFRDAFYMLQKRARNTGRWISEPWTNIYFNMWKLMLVWDLIDDDPFFSDQDRQVIEEVLWGYTNFIRWLPNLDPDQALPGEMRQNHTTFLALSLYFSHRYYTRKYNLKGLDSMMDKVYRAFEGGQVNSFIPNDDAGGYIKYSPLHTLTYLLAENKMEYIENGSLARTTDLIATIFDNRGDQVSFGDVGGYSHKGPNSSRGTELKFFAMSARYYNEPQYQWLYNWLSAGKKFSLNNLGNNSGNRENPIQFHFDNSDDMVFSLESIYSGEYATPMAASAPSKFTGIQTIPLDEPARDWVGRRAWSNNRLPLQDYNYFHKIAFRRNFNPNDEYLLLDGLSAFSHGHHDGNSILRLTWKDRIWLFDLDYIKFPSKYHNGVTVVRDGIQQNPPPLTRLDFTANNPDFGLTRSTAQNYNGANWERTILWRKNHWFFVLDRMKANEGGDYRLVGRWRTRGKVSLEDSHLRVVQGDKSFYIKNADNAHRRLEFEPDGHRSNWSDYPWGDGGLDVLAARKEKTLAPDEDFIFANLLAASDDTIDPGYDLLKVAENLYQVTDSASSPLLIGSDPTRFETFGLSTDASIFLIDSDALYLIDAGRVRFNGKLLDNSSHSRHLKFDIQAGTLQNFQGNTIRQLDESTAKSLRHFATTIFNFSSQLAHEVQPDMTHSKLEDFGLRRLGRIGLDAPITARTENGEELLIGDAKGRLLYFHNDSSYKTITTPHGSEITTITSGDLDNDGTIEIIAGDREENIYCYTIDGKLLWKHKLTAFYGADAFARDITVDTIDDSGNPVVLVANGGWKVYAIEAGGNILWESFVFYHPLTRVSVLNTGGEGRYIVAGTEYHTPFNVIDPETGKVIYHAWEEMGSEFISSTEYFGIHLTDMTFFDANRDSLRDIVFGTLSNKVYAVNAADGAKIWEVNAGDEVTALAQFNDPTTDDLRVLVANGAGDLSVFDREGNRLHHAQLADSRITSLRVLPAEQGRVDIAATTQGGDLVIVDETLLVRAAHHFDEPLGGVFLTGRRGRSHQLLGIGADSVYRVGYEAFHLRKSWHY